MFLIPSLKKQNPSVPPAQKPALCCPKCGKDLYISASIHHCPFCNKNWTDEVLMLDYSQAAKSAYQDRVAARANEMMADNAMHELQKERALRCQLGDELNHLRLENDPRYLADSISRLDQRLSSMETLLHDMLED